MNWKEFLGGVVATALLVLFALWTTDFEIGSKGGYSLAVGIIFVMSIVWRVLANPLFSAEEITWSKVKAYSLGALVASALAVIAVV